MSLSPLSFVAGVEHQKKSLWDFYFIDNFTFKYRIKSMTLPLPQFEIETRHTWENFYKDMTLNTTFTIEIYEDIYFNTYRYFKGWRDSIYDLTTRKFVSYAPFISQLNPIFKTAILSYYPGDINRDAANPYSVPTAIFTLSNVKLIGLSDLTNDYEDGSALIYTVSLAYENIVEVFTFRPSDNTAAPETSILGQLPIA